MKKKLILIGASTGGPGHLKKIFSALNGDFGVPIIVAQHMNQVFIESFARQFNEELNHKVILANKKHKLEDNYIYICAKHCEIIKEHDNLFLKAMDISNSNYNPSIENLFNSVKNFVNEFDILAILLTGIGSDGAYGLSDLQKLGSTCIAESEESAIVYGMPKVAAEINKDIHVMSLEKIIEKIKQFTLDRYI
ncbi:CheB methylesterase domain-containing protein [Sulfurospirillum sp. 1307]|jgi:two-component system chemotaxis response regulator CheB